MSWITDAADRTAGALQGVRDAVRAEWAAADRGAAGEADRAKADAEPEARPVSKTAREYPPGRPATALEASEALQAGDLRNPEARAAIFSYLSSDPAPRFDTPADRAKAEAGRDGLEAGR